jgi:hypothetical protein
MATTRTETLGARPATLATDTSTLDARRLAFWGMVVAKLVAGWGVQWDILWHIRIGRDSFWIAPHVMTYAGVTGVVLLSFGLLAWETVGRRRPRAGDITVLGITSSPGFHLAAWGIALTVLAAPIDDLWHRLFGIDVTLWSPPHLLGILGGVVNSWGCLLIARELYADGVMRLLGIAVSGAGLFRGLHLTVEPSSLVAYVHGGVRFFTLAILSSLILPLALIPAAQLAERRWMPLAVLALVIGSGVIGTSIARTGFEALQPVSVIDEEIAKDPTSPIALANAIARKTGGTPGATGGLFHVVSAIPVLALVLVGPRQRPELAAMAYGAALLVTSGRAFAGSPAFAAQVPGAGETAAAMVLVLVAGAIGGHLARRLSDALAPGTAGPRQRPIRTRE